MRAGFEGRFFLVWKTSLFGGLSSTFALQMKTKAWLAVSKQLVDAGFWSELKN